MLLLWLLRHLLAGLLLLLWAVLLTLALLPPLMIVLLLITAFHLFWFLSFRGRSSHPDWHLLEGWLYAHRGLHDQEAGIPENSLSAFRRAADQGFGAELDVHLTRDGRLVVIHDDTLLRTAGADVRVSSLTINDLDRYTLLGSGEKIPLLEEVLPLFEGRAPLLVELKAEGNAGALARAAVQTLDRFRVKYAVESFHPGVLLWLKRHRPDVCRGQLAEDFRRPSAPLSGLAAWAAAHMLGNLLTAPDFIAYRFIHRRNCPCIRRARTHWGVREAGWTIRSQQELEQCLREKVIPIFEGFLPDVSARGL